MENKKKTKGFVETPSLIVGLMHKWLDLKNGEKLGDFTAGQGALFSDYDKKNCYGIELDEVNFVILKNKGFENIIFGDFFENIGKVPEVEKLILNPPYLKNSNEFIYKSLEKLKDGGRFAIISKASDFKRFFEKYDVWNLNCVLAMDFDTNLFKPFANVATLLIFGIKGQKQGDFEIQKFSNDELKVNTRSKFVDIKILSPKEVKAGTGNFWEKLNEVPENEPPTYEDFRRTVVNYMAWETGFPVEFLEKPEKFWQAYNKLMNRGKTWEKK